MFVHRALACCPKCNEAAEVWYYKSKIEPLPLVECVTCFTVYDAADFITKLLDLYKDESVSSMLS